MPKNSETSEAESSVTKQAPFKETNVTGRPSTASVSPFTTVPSSTSLSSNATSMSVKTSSVSQSTTCSPFPFSTNAPSPLSTFSTSPQAFVSSTSSITSLAAKSPSPSKSVTEFLAEGQG